MSTAISAHLKQGLPDRYVGDMDSEYFYGSAYGRYLIGAYYVTTPRMRCLARVACCLLCAGFACTSVW